MVGRYFSATAPFANLSGTATIEASIGSFGCQVSKEWDTSSSNLVENLAKFQPDIVEV